MPGRKAAGSGASQQKGWAWLLSQEVKAARWHCDSPQCSTFSPEGQWLVLF